MTRESGSAPLGAIPFTPLVATLPASIPFVGPEALERSRGRTFIARIGANESAFGPSPSALAAMRAALERSAWYGDPENHELRAALAHRHGIDPSNVCVDAGIDSLLGLLVRMLASPGSPVVMSQGAYPTFAYHVRGFGAQVHTVPYANDHEDPQALVRAMHDTGASLGYLANPDNPMGTWHDAATLARALDALPTDSVLALDEAYVEFAPAGTSPALDVDDPRVIRLRTFSKAYGMAGLRVGYALGHRDLVTGLDKVRNHFAVNRIAQAGALASLGDAEHLASVVERVGAGRERIHALARRHGLHSLPSATNFVAVDLGNAQRATRLLERLREADVFVRMPGVAPLNRCVRIGVGDAQEHAAFEAAFERLLPGLDRP